MPPRIHIQPSSIRKSLPARISPVQPRNLSATVARCDEKNPLSGPLSTIGTPTSTATTTSTTTTAATTTREASPYAGVSRPIASAVGAATRKRTGSGQDTLNKYMVDMTKQKEKLEAERRYKRERNKTAAQANAQANERQRTVSQETALTLSDELMSLMGLRLQDGDLYSPHDLTPAEMRHYIGRNALNKGTPKFDAIAESGVNPLDLYKNFTLIEQWRTEAGRIRHSKETGFSPVNQRKVSRAVRRAIGLALVPSTHAHPEMLARNLAAVETLTTKPIQRVGAIHWEGKTEPPVKK